MRGQFHAVIWDKLVNIAVLVPLRLRMANQYNHLNLLSAGASVAYLATAPLTRGFPMLVICIATRVVLEGYVKTEVYMSGVKRVRAKRNRQVQGTQLKRRFVSSSSSANMRRLRWCNCAAGVSGPPYRSSGAKVQARPLHHLQHLSQAALPYALQTILSRRWSRSIVRNRTI